jgi:hypothetical protein
MSEYQEKGTVQMVRHILAYGLRYEHPFRRNSFRNDFAESFRVYQSTVSGFLLTAFHLERLDPLRKSFGLSGFLGSYDSKKLAVIKSFMLRQYYLAVDQEEINPNGTTLKNLSMSELESAAEAEAIELAKLFNRPAIVDSPKRGFKPYELIAFTPLGDKILEESFEINQELLDQLNLGSVPLGGRKSLDILSQNGVSIFS